MLGTANVWQKGVYLVRCSINTIRGRPLFGVLWVPSAFASLQTYINRYGSSLDTQYLALKY